MSPGSPHPVTRKGGPVQEPEPAGGPVPGELGAAVPVVVAGHRDVTGSAPRHRDERRLDVPRSGPRAREAPGVAIGAVALRIVPAARGVDARRRRSRAGRTAAGTRAAGRHRGSSFGGRPRCLGTARDPRRLLLKGGPALAALDPLVGEWSMAARFERRVRRRGAMTRRQPRPIRSHRPGHARQCRGGTDSMPAIHRHRSR